MCGCVKLHSSVHFSCSEMLRIVEKNDPGMIPSLWMNGTKSSSAVDTRYRPAEINKIERHSQNQVCLIDQLLEIFIKHAETICSLSVYVSFLCVLLVLLCGLSI